jgi:SAM-dependent methyltransferase
LVDLEANARRFSGFADLYDRVRPSPPAAVAELILDYAATSRAEQVVDLGSGTGLSSRWAARWADAVVGIEPSDDMRRHAATNPAANMFFRAGWAHDTGLADGCADVVLAVQALHWMEPEATFTEVARVLRPGGVFVAMDCDWPPVVGNWQAEAAWCQCQAALKDHGDRLAGADNRDQLQWSKEQHLARMTASGAFRWCRELAAQTVEPGDDRRFVDLLRSHAQVQQLLAAGLDEETLGITTFQATVEEELGGRPRPFWFTYRIRLAVK